VSTPGAAARTRQPAAQRRGRLARVIGAVALLILGAGCGQRDTPAAAPAPAPTTDLPAFSVLAGSELKDLEPALIAAAQGAGVKLELSYAGGLDIVERINAGEHFDAILPANGAYPALALQSKPLARDKLFYSRIALGVKPAKAAALGWDKKPPGWAEIARAAATGQLRYGMTNPTSSNTGMSALFAVASALAGKSEDLEVSDVDSKTLKAFLSGHKLTAGSSGWLAEAYVKNPSAIDAMVNYEAVILRANAGLATADQLRLIYPRDGMISADYPLMLLAEPQRATYDKLIAAIKAVPFQRDVLAGAYLRPANAEVAANPALPGGALAELSFPNRLEVIDAVLASYQAQWRQPATSIFVLDVSGSMRGDRLAAMREALKVLAGADAAATASARYAAFQNRERVVLITFSNAVAEPVWVRFDAATLAAARAQVLSLADGLTVQGGTALYSALAAAQELARTERRREPDRTLSIVLLTDGESNAGLSFRDFLDRWGSDSPTRVFPILFGEGNVAEMQQLAQATGGREFDGRKARLAQVFKEIRGYQ
jgi:Ca-activated chloride channel family protein